MTLPWIGRTTGAVTNPERAAVKESGTLVNARTPGPSARRAAQTPDTRYAPRRRRRTGARRSVRSSPQRRVSRHPAAAGTPRPRAAGEGVARRDVAGHDRRTGYRPQRHPGPDSARPEHERHRPTAPPAPAAHLPAAQPPTPPRRDAKADTRRPASTHHSRHTLAPHVLITTRTLPGKRTATPSPPSALPHPPYPRPSHPCHAPLPCRSMSLKHSFRPATVTFRPPCPQDERLSCMPDVNRRRFLQLAGATTAFSALSASIQRAAALLKRTTAPGRSRTSSTSSSSCRRTAPSTTTSHHPQRRPRLRRPPPGQPRQRQTGLAPAQGRHGTPALPPGRRRPRHAVPRGPAAFLARWPTGLQRWQLRRLGARQRHHDHGVPDPRGHPFHFALADAFTVCDAYHCSFIGSTDPNRYYMWSGYTGNDGSGGGPVLDNAELGYGWTTYPERLEQARHLLEDLPGHRRRPGRG